MTFAMYPLTEAMPLFRAAPTRPCSTPPNAPATAIPYSCRKGVCSTCEGELRRGGVTVGSKPDSQVPTPPFCCARPNRHPTF